ncbi:MAG: hypothetical protein ACI9KE_002717 [Polyangiales bacterium]|jgi:hypothetical protein
MGTWTAFYVGADLDQTVAGCADWLREKSGKKTVA